MPENKRRKRNRLNDFGRVRLNEYRDPARQYSPSYVEKSKIKFWKQWHNEMALCLAKGMFLPETAKAVGKGLSTVRNLSRTDRMVEKVAEYRQKLEEDLLADAAERMRDTLDILKDEEEAAARKIVETIEDEKTQKGSLLKAIELLYKLTGRLDKKGETLQTNIVLGEDLLQKWQKLHERESE